MARPKNSGEGSVKQRANGRWLARVRIDGKHYNRTVGSKAEGNRWLREMKAKADQGLITVDAHNLTFGAYLDHWLDAIAGSVGHKTWEGYEWAVRCHLKPGLGHYKLAELKALHLGTLYAGKVKQADPKTGKPLAAASVNLIHRTARAALNRAVEWNYLVQSPTLGLLSRGSHGASAPSGTRTRWSGSWRRSRGTGWSPPSGSCSPSACKRWRMPRRTALVRLLRALTGGSKPLTWWMRFACVGIAASRPTTGVPGRERKV